MAFFLGGGEFDRRQLREVLDRPTPEARQPVGCGTFVDHAGQAYLAGPRGRRVALAAVTEASTSNWAALQQVDPRRPGCPRGSATADTKACTAMLLTTTVEVPV